jgi:hypothetical protein
MSGNTKSTPIDHEVHNNKYLVRSVNNILKEIVEENRSINDIPDKYKRLSFYSKHSASITVTGYLERILKYTHIEESTLIIALIYLDRVCEINSIQLNEFNIHRILFASVIVAIKYNEDDYYTNGYYSKVGGISVKELNTLEYEYVKLLKYNLYIKTEVYDKYKQFLNHQIRN